MKFLEFIYESHGLHVQIDVENVNDEFIKELIDNLSFVYKKRKDRYIRPKNITGKMLDDTFKLTIIMYNKDIINIDYIGDILTLKINDELVYDMDNITKEMVSKKIYNVYSKYISNQNFKIVTKNNEI